MNATFEALGTSTGFPRVSIYFPTHPTFPDYEQDPIRLSNALRRVASELEQVGYSQTDIGGLLDEARARGKDDPFWRYQDHGLGVFIEAGRTEWVRLPAAPPELTVVADKYHVRPVIHFLRDQGGYHVLTVSRDGPHFYNGSHDRSGTGLQEIHLEAFPESLEELRERTDLDTNVGFHTRDRGSRVGGSNAPKFAALGESPDDYDDTLLDGYTRAVAKAVDGHLATSRAPLAVIALPRTLGRLKQQITYREALFDGEASDPHALDAQGLERRALGIVEPRLTEDRENLRDRMRQAAAGSGQPFLSNLQEIIHAAEAGRVEAVFLAENETVWGHYDPAYRVVRIDHESGPQNEDLLNLAALKTLATGGEARTLPDDLTAEIGPIAALLRY